MDEAIWERYEIIGRPFKSQFRGTCTLDRDHEIKRGELVARVQRADNPMLVVGGVACKMCISEMKR